LSYFTLGPLGPVVGKLVGASVGDLTVFPVIILFLPELGGAQLGGAKNGGALLGGALLGDNTNSPSSYQLQPPQEEKKQKLVIYAPLLTFQEQRFWLKEIA
jgi:hypothetical protein